MDNSITPFRKIRFDHIIREHALKMLDNFSDYQLLKGRKYIFKRSFEIFAEIFDTLEVYYEAEEAEIAIRKKEREESKSKKN